MTEMSRVERRKAQLRAEQQVAAAADEQIEYLEDSPDKTICKRRSVKKEEQVKENQNKNVAVHFSDRPVHYRNNRCLFRSSLYDEQQQI